MNIICAMDALKVTDLDRTARHALLVLACHADRTSASATVSIERLADELGVGYGTAWRALHRAMKAGYLEAQPVDKHPSEPRVWLLRGRASARDGVARGMSKGRAPARDLKKKIEKDWSARDAHSPQAVSAGAVENGNGAGRHPDSCSCGGTGWLAGADATVSRCLEVKP